jgi:hypothetical protein
MTDKEMLQRILARCTEDGGCLVWTGAMADGSCPQMRVDKKTVNLRRKHYELTVGPIPAGMVVAVTCECQRCIRHVQPMTTSDVCQRHAARGAYTSLTAQAKIAAAKRKNSRYSQELIQQIRASDEPGHILAARFQMTETYLSQIRRGRQRKDYTGNPFLAMVARTNNDERQQA